MKTVIGFILLILIIIMNAIIHMFLPEIGEAGYMVLAYVIYFILIFVFLILGILFDD